MGVGRQVLLQQIFPVVVSIRSPHGGVNVILGRGATSAESNGALVVEFDQDDGTVDAIVEDGLLVHFADPGETCPVEVLFDLLHLHFGMAIFQIVNPEPCQFEKDLLGKPWGTSNVYGLSESDYSGFRFIANHNLEAAVDECAAI